jgi:hypothetical protein
VRRRTVSKSSEDIGHTEFSNFAGSAGLGMIQYTSRGPIMKVPGAQCRGERGGAAARGHYRSYDEMV